MRYSTASVLVTAALSVGQASASPTHGHAHLHRDVHEKKAVFDAEWWSTVVDWKTVNYDGTTTKAAATTTTKAAVVAAATTTTAAQAKTTSTAKASSTGSSSSSSSSTTDDLTSTIEGLLGGLVGVANSLTAFGSATASSNCPGIMCINNVGNPYGSNMIKVKSTDGHAYTNTFVNTQKKAITVNIWNKAGHDGQANSGQSLAPKATTLTFVLQPGASQVVAFMENTSGGFCEATTKVQSYGAFDTTWGEWSYIDGGSAYDVSAIQNSAGNKYNMTMTSSEAACTSDMNKNMWITDSLSIGPDGTAQYDSSGAATGGDCVALGNSMHVVTTLGGSVA